MNWHDPTEDEHEGIGEHIYAVDIFPDICAHQAATDGDALLRVYKPSWSWMILNRIADTYVASGDEDTKDAAIGAAQAALAELRA